MTDLRWHDLERSLRRRVRRDVEATPHLRAEARRQRISRWRRTLPAWIGQWFWATCLGGWWGLGFGDAVGLELSLAALALWSLMGVGIQAGALHHALHESHHLPVLYLLPLTDLEVFRCQWRAFVRRSVGFILFHVPAGGFLAVQCATDGGQAAACVVLPPLQAALFSALAVHGEALWPRGAQRHLTKLWVLMLAALFGWKSLAALTPALVTAGYWVPPFGWLNWTFHRGAIGGDPWAWTLLIPVALALWTLPWSKERLRARYVLPEPDWTGQVLDASESEIPDSTESAAPVSSHEGVTAIEDTIRSGVWRLPRDWSHHRWLERHVAARLSPRERLAAEFLTAGDPAWSPHGRWMAVALTVAAGLIVLYPGQKLGVVLFAGFLVLASAAPLLGGSWAGLRHAVTGTVRAPLYALYPIALGDLVRVMLKVNAARCLVALPPLLAVGALGGWKLQVGIWPGLAFALKAVGFLVVLQPALVMFRFSTDTADTRQLSWYWVVFLLAGAVGLVGLGAWVFTATSVLSAVGGLASTLFWAASLLTLYAFLWGRSRFDLLSPIEPD